MKSRIKNYIKSCHIMTLGTVHQLMPWTAPVFYIYHKTDFYFFSKNSSRHIQDIAQSQRAAASIHHNPKDWMDIKGIQMEGVISDAGTGPKAATAFDHYLKGFTFIGNLPFQPFTGSLNVFKKQFNVEWYIFMPRKLVYLDNSIEFGYKLELTPDLEVC